MSPNRSLMQRLRPLAAVALLACLSWAAAPRVAADLPRPRLVAAIIPAARAPEPDATPQPPQWQ